MLHAYVQTFDVMERKVFTLGTKQGLREYLPQKIEGNQ
jgi:hypothetical protein